jgi:hypothetical protein
MSVLPEHGLKIAKRMATDSFWRGSGLKKGISPAA